jgi:hypothetical protein
MFAEYVRIEGDAESKRLGINMLFWEYQQRGNDARIVKGIPGFTA